MVQFIDLAAQYLKLQAEIDQRIQKVLQHGKYIMGPEVAELETALAEYIGVQHAISCSSGTDALLMPLLAWGIGRGDAVFTTPFTFMATAEVISLVGATPVFVDIDPDTFNIDPAQLETAIGQVTKEGRLQPRVILTVDLFGLPADYDRIEVIAQKHHLKILEDAAQGFGGVYKGRRAGSFGTAAGTSFFPAKPLGCYGDGGAIFTDDPELAAVLRSIRVHGQGSDKYDNVRIGLNARLDTIQAAILLVKLRAFIDYELEARERFAGLYTAGLKDLVRTPVVPAGLASAWAQYSILASNSTARTVLQQRLQAEGIPTMIYYRKPLHLQAAFRDLGYKEGDFPVAEDVSSRVFSLPLHPYLQETVVQRVIELIAATKELKAP